MGDVTGGPARGIGETAFRVVRCKDCVREGESPTSESDAFEYSEAWAARVIDRGGSRTDRCTRHRREHRQAIQGMAVAYVDLETIGEVADRTNPTGPLGGLGPLPTVHRLKRVSVDLETRKFGMTDDHIREALRKLTNPATRVLVLKAGTGTGKSTFGPYRLMVPPTGRPGDEQLIRLTSFGPIVVTEPRVQATTGVARFVGEKLVMNCAWKVCSLHGRFVSPEDDVGIPQGPAHAGEITDDCVISDCAEHIGPGYPVGYQVKDDKKHDESCQLVYVTDGTMVNWLREGRLSKIGAVVVDEAHERSVNIDFILGELRRQLDRFPHLRVVVTSATFDVDFYVDFFGGPSKVEWMDVPAVKTFGYGAPLFPYASGQSNVVPPCVCPSAAEDPDGPHRDGDPTDLDDWVATHWPKLGPADGGSEDLQATTRLLERLRFAGPITQDPNNWAREMTELVVGQLTRMIHGLDEMQIEGDILAFLPTQKMITTAVERVQASINPGQADVYGLLGTMPKALQAAALAARPPGSRRKVVIATNLAETSLTVEGVRFVVDTGIINQSTWNPETASGSPRILPHSQAGIRQRWGRVGRDAPGWVFPLYTAEQFRMLPQDTPPGSTRQNLEQLIMTAKAGGVDDVEDFPWPARSTFNMADKSAEESQATFVKELSRAGRALERSGILDDDGHLTTFGREVQRFAAVGKPVATGLAIIVADQLACVPEVAAGLALLDPDGGVRGRIFLDDREWPEDARLEAATRRTALSIGCDDDLDLVLRISAAWDRSDPTAPPWRLTAVRRRWCRHLWINDEVLLAAAESRHEILSSLSPAMTEEVKRFVDLRLADRARAVLSRALVNLHYERADGRFFRSVADPTQSFARIHPSSLIGRDADLVLAFGREAREFSGQRTVQLRNIVRVFSWAADPELDVMELIERASMRLAPRLRPRGGSELVADALASWPVGIRFRGTITRTDDGIATAAVHEVLPARTPLGDLHPDDGEDPAELTSRELNWTYGEPLPDEEDELRRPTDTSDDPVDPERGTETNDDESTAALTAQSEPREIVHDVGVISRDRPVVILDDGEGHAAGDTSGLYACNGYRLRANGEVALEIGSHVVALEVAVPSDDKKRVIGKDHRHIDRIRALPGIAYCDFDPSGPLRLVATSATAATAALHLIDRQPEVTGTMRMPRVSDWGPLMGGGETIKRLRQESGCTTTTLPKGDVVWHLAAPSPSNILRFVELANAIVPGCVGELHESPKPMSVRDIGTSLDVADWRVHAFAALAVDQWPRTAASTGALGAALLDGIAAEDVQLDDEERAPVSRASLSLLGWHEDDIELFFTSTAGIAGTAVCEGDRWVVGDSTFMPHAVSLLVGTGDADRRLAAALTASGNLWMSEAAGDEQWSRWSRTPRPPFAVRDVALVIRDSGYYEAVAVGLSGELAVSECHRGFVWGEWSEWMTRGVVCIDAAAAGQRQVLLAGTDGGQLWLTTREGSKEWGEWTRVATFADDLVDVGVSIDHYGRCLAAAVTTTGRLSLSHQAIGDSLHFMEIVASGVVRTATWMDFAGGRVLAMERTGPIRSKVVVSGEKDAPWELIAVAQ